MPRKRELTRIEVLTGPIGDYEASRRIGPIDDYLRERPRAGWRGRYDHTLLRILADDLLAMGAGDLYVDWSPDDDDSSDPDCLIVLLPEPGIAWFHLYHYLDCVRGLKVQYDRFGERPSLTAGYPK